MSAPPPIAVKHWHRSETPLRGTADSCSAANDAHRLHHFLRSPRRYDRVPSFAKMKRYGISAHSPLMFAVRITLPHFSVYSTMNLANSVGELTNGSAPKSTSRALNVGSARAAFTCLLRIAMISGGVPAGAAIPSQLLAS